MEPITRIRPAAPGDVSAAYTVCRQTGAAGRDATAMYDDPDLLGHLYVGPYLALEPGLAFVLEDAGGVCGYTLGALDSREFYARCERDWWPPLRERVPLPPGDRLVWSPADFLRRQVHRPEVYQPEPQLEFPSHLHIDLLPRSQGQGWGGLMIATLLNRLRELGSCGVHLGQHVSNARAERFYLKMGFRELARRGETLYLGFRFR